MQNIEVSVIITSYNVEQYIKQAVDSVLMQKTTFPFEVIIGDDVSSDRTAQILEEYKDLDNVQIIIREKNIGGCANALECLKKSKGKFITGLDGDDFWTDENKLQKQWEFLKKFSQYLAIGHHRYLVDEDNNYLENENIGTIKGYPVTMSDILSGRKCYSFSTLLYRRESVMEPSLKVDMLLKLDRNQADNVLSHLILSQGDIYILEDVCSVYRKFLRRKGNNFNSIFSSYQMFRSRINIDIGLERYFNGKYDYTVRIMKDTVGYIFHCMRHCEKLQLNEMRQLMGIKRLLFSMIYFPVYAVRTTINKIRKSFIGIHF